MKLTSNIRNGTMILLELAMCQKDQVVSLSAISRRQGISLKYLEQLIRPLKKSGLVDSVRGPKGGHFLTVNPDKVTLGQITRIFEGSIDLVECINDSEKCSKAEECVTRKAWQMAAQALFDQLDGITIANLMAETKCIK